MSYLKSIKISAGAFLLFLYLFFCWLMLKIILQYIPAGTDTAFLGIKQDYTRSSFYLAVFYVHVFTSGFALLAGLTQFSKPVLKSYPCLHRLQGRMYVFLILSLAGPSGLIIGFYANGGIVSRISFCLLASLWIYFTYMAYYHARQRNFVAHKAFMYRSFALTVSALTLRAWKYTLVGVFHPHPMDVYRVVAWLGWVPNLLLAEYLIYKNQNK